MFIQKTQMVATLYTVIFHSPQAAASFEIETELRAGVFSLKRSLTSVSFGLFNPIEGELWAKDFEARWIARIEAEMRGEGDPATPEAITKSYQEPFHGNIDNVDELMKEAHVAAEEKAAAEKAAAEKAAAEETSPPVEVASEVKEVKEEDGT